MPSSIPPEIQKKKKRKQSFDWDVWCVTPLSWDFHSGLFWESPTLGLGDTPSAMIRQGGHTKYINETERGRFVPLYLNPPTFSAKDRPGERPIRERNITCLLEDCLYSVPSVSITKKVKWLGKTPWSLLILLDLHILPFKYEGEQRVQPSTFIWQCWQLEDSDHSPLLCHVRHLGELPGLGEPQWGEELVF